MNKYPSVKIGFGESEKSLIKLRAKYEQERDERLNKFQQEAIKHSEEYVDRVGSQTRDRVNARRSIYIQQQALINTLTAVSLHKIADMRSRSTELVDASLKDLGRAAMDYQSSESNLLTTVNASMTGFIGATTGLKSRMTSSDPNIRARYNAARAAIGKPPISSEIAAPTNPGKAARGYVEGGLDTLVGASQAVGDFVEKTGEPLAAITSQGKQRQAPLYRRRAEDAEDVADYAQMMRENESYVQGLKENEALRDPGIKRQAQDSLREEILAMFPGVDGKTREVIQAVLSGDQKATEGLNYAGKHVRIANKLLGRAAAFTSILVGSDLDPQVISNAMKQYAPDMTQKEIEAMSTVFQDQAKAGQLFKFDPEEKAILAQMTAIMNEGAIKTGSVVTNEEIATRISGRLASIMAASRLEEASGFSQKMLGEEARKSHAIGVVQALAARGDAPEYSKFFNDVFLVSKTPILESIIEQGTSLLTNSAAGSGPSMGWLTPEEAAKVAGNVSRFANGYLDKVELGAKLDATNSDFEARISKARQVARDFQAKVKWVNQGKDPEDLRRRALALERASFSETGELRDISDAEQVVTEGARPTLPDGKPMVGPIKESDYEFQDADPDNLLSDTVSPQFGSVAASGMRAIGGADSPEQMRTVRQGLVSQYGLDEPTPAGQSPQPLEGAERDVLREINEEELGTMQTSLTGYKQGIADTLDERMKSLREASDVFADRRSPRDLDKGDDFVSTASWQSRREKQLAAIPKEMPPWAMPPQPVQQQQQRPLTFAANGQQPQQKIKTPTASELQKPITSV